MRGADLGDGDRLGLKAAGGSAGDGDRGDDDDGVGDQVI